MKALAAKDAKNGFGRLLDMAQREPISIEKKGRPVAVVLSTEEYQRLENLEERYWADRAAQVEKEGFIGKDKSESLLSDLLNAES